LAGHGEARVIGFPLLLIPFAIYNMIAFLTPGVSWTGALYSVPIPLKSGVSWAPTAGDALLAFSLLMLMCEFIKSARQGKSFVEHFLALLLVGGATAEFVMVREAGNSTFFLFVAICFVDLFAGFAASIRRVRRAVVAEAEPAGYPKVARTEPAEPVRAEPARVEPVHAEPFGRVEPAGAAVRTEPAISPVQKAEP
jgi:hypothetical protein